MEKVLIIEDEESIAELISLTLSTVGFKVTVAADGVSGLEKLDTNPDIVLLDLMLPGMSGYELLPRIIKRKMPVILLTARDSLVDKVKCLELGADDYVTKPFADLELLARIRAVLRRTGKRTPRFQFDDVTLCVDERRVFQRDIEVELTPKEFDLLRTLIENKGMAMSREQLLQIVWDYSYQGDTRTVDMHIQRLRQKLGTSRISTVYKLGYRFEA